MKATFILKLMMGMLMLGVMCNCANKPGSAPVKIFTPEVQAQVIGDAEKVLLAGGGALLLTGNGGAAVAAMTAQEVQNIPGLQKVLANGTPATVTVPASSAQVPNALLPAVSP